jgi:hypothetical protein
MRIATQRKIKIRIRDAGEVMEYDAVVRKSDGEVLEMSGYTYCDDRECVKQIIKRALAGQRDPPPDVEKAVEHVVDFLLTSIKSFYTDNVSASLSLDAGVDAEMRLFVSLHYLDGGEVEDEEEYVGWYAELETAFMGCDGVAVDGFHQLKKELTLGRYLDEDAVKKLVEELMELAKLAYNITPPR